MRAAEPRLLSSRGGRLVLAASLAGLGLGLLGFLGPIGRDDVLRWFHVGYRREIGALLDRGQFAAALEELERGSLVDRERAELLDRMALLNQAAGVRSAPMAQLARSRREDAEVRFRVGNALLGTLGAGSGRSPEQREILERATENARVLAALEPDSARSHYLLGSMHLLRWRAGDGADERAEAASHIQRAISIEPTHAGALRALRSLERARHPEREPRG